MKVLLIIAPQNFRDEEFFYTKEELEKAGHQIEVASTKKGVAKGMLGGEWQVNKTLEEINVDDWDAIIFIGGSGTPIVRSHPLSIEIVKKAYEKGKVIGAICWAPTILAKAGILKEKRATVWEGFDPEYNKTTSQVLMDFGAIYTGEDVVVDGKIITANGPRAARKFGKKIAELLKS